MKKRETEGKNCAIIKKERKKREIEGKKCPILKKRKKLKERTANSYKKGKEKEKN